MRMMKGDFLSVFIGNPARARIVRVFIFSPAEQLTESKIVRRAGVSAASAKKELRALERMSVLKKMKCAPDNKKESTKQRKAEFAWHLNQKFAHERALSSFVHEVSPMHYRGVVDALRTAGRLTAVVVSGCFVGDSTRPIDLLVAADNLNESRLDHALKSFEPIFGREIRYSAFSTPEFRYRLTIQDRLIRDTLDYPHFVLLDRTRLL